MWVSVPSRCTPAVDVRSSRFPRGSPSKSAVGRSEGGRARDSENLLTVCTTFGPAELGTSIKRETTSTAAYLRQHQGCQCVGELQPKVGRRVQKQADDKGDEHQVVGQPKVVEVVQVIADPGVF